MHVLAVLCSPHSSTKTRAVVDALLGGAEAAGATTEVVEVGGASAPAELQERLAAATAVVFASPTYRADVTWPLKALLDSTPRGFWGETSAPLEGKAAATVLTGASDHHFLGMDKVRAVLSGFFAMQLLSPGLYVSRAGFDDDGGVREDVRALAEQHGRALVALAGAVAGSEDLRALRPLV